MLLYVPVKRFSCYCTSNWSGLHRVDRRPLHIAHRLSACLLSRQMFARCPVYSAVHLKKSRSRVRFFINYRYRTHIFCDGVKYIHGVEDTIVAISHTHRDTQTYSHCTFNVTTKLWFSPTSFVDEHEYSPICCRSRFVRCNVSVVSPDIRIPYNSKCQIMFVIVIAVVVVWHLNHTERSSPSAWNFWHKLISIVAHKANSTNNLHF